MVGFIRCQKRDLAVEEQPKVGRSPDAIIVTGW